MRPTGKIARPRPERGQRPDPSRDTGEETGDATEGEAPGGCLGGEHRQVHIHDAETLGVSLPRGVPYPYRLTSWVPVVVQHSRLDTTQPAYTLFTTIGYWESD